MEKEYIDTLLDQLKKDLASHSPPHARYDKNHKTISVTYDFDHGFIKKVWIIAPREKWLELYSLEKITFDDIEPWLSKYLSKKTRSELKTYFDKWPDDFFSDVLTCIEYANAHNPLYVPATKPRGRSSMYHDFDWHKMNEIRATARHLYVYLGHNIEKPFNQQPVRIDKLFKAYKIDNIEDIRTATMEIIYRFFDFEMFALKLEVDPSEMFYRKYIQLPGQPLSKLKRFKRITQGKGPFLEKVFAILKN